MLLDLPRPVYVTDVYPLHSFQQEIQIDPAQSFVHSLTISSNLSALAQSENQVEELSRMPAGWDGYGALPISSKTKYNALQALRGILAHAPTPDITPNSNGTLSFEWETERGFAHLEVGQTRLSFYIELASAEPVFLDSSCEGLLIAAIRVGFLVSSNLFPWRSTPASITMVRLAAHVSSAY